MNALDTITDSIGQALFRVETNLEVVRHNISGMTPAQRACDPLMKAITEDLEKLKALKSTLEFLPAVVLEESGRQLVLMALAHLSLERPGWDAALKEVAEQMKGGRMYEQFKDLHRDAIRLAGALPGSAA